MPATETGDEMTWELVSGDEVVATLTPRTDAEERWRECDFEAAPGFDEFRALFERDVHVLEQGQVTGDHDHWSREYDKVWRQIWDTGLALRLDDGRLAETWIIHVYPDHAKVRHADPDLT